ncbi:hypothetical protein PSTG_14631 [Puccinia striiformis f. sp. tritici PST-78]|uniref:Tip elongation aberrant protein 1 n=1 Tax=Puccinia striiformis f. sp. tritici PST-78 TaxID=1165861 RepID=A0A0L0UY82_9BASI|nr:hypothetical protein PSTG_14631 [Puccinia striiformis f. sp. tritici PST-78]
MAGDSGGQNNRQLTASTPPSGAGLSLLAERPELERSSSTTNNKLHRKISINQPKNSSNNNQSKKNDQQQQQPVELNHQRTMTQPAELNHYHQRTTTATTTASTTNTNETHNTNPSLRQTVTRNSRPFTANTVATLPSHPSNSRLPLLPTARVEVSPAACMYLSKASIHGPKLIKPLRAHTATLVNDSIWIFGGTDLNGCFKDVWKLDLETLSFTKMKCKGFEEDPSDDHITSFSDDDPNHWLSSSSNPHRRPFRTLPKDHLPPPTRAHSATHLDGRIFIFGGGDGPNYFDVLYYLDTISLTWTKPRVKGILPSTRRAHATVLYGTQLIIFGGGNGSRALNDVHALDLSDLSNLEWRELAINGQSPLNRGYHSANLVGSKCIIFGGSDGGECFSDIYILDLESLTWIQVEVEAPIARLAHTSTQVGSYLFVIGGHDGEDYTSEVKLFNLVTLQWEPRTVKGQLPPRIGYHTATLHDSRLIIIGGFDGRHVYDQVWCLELASSAYLPQVTNFTIPVDDPSEEDL